MKVKSYLSRVLALVLVLVVTLVGCSSPTGLTGNYTDDTFAVVEKLITAIDLPDDAPNRQEVLGLAKDEINDYISRYRRDDKNSGLRSFTTMQTALNSLAGYYNSYGNRPLPDNLKQRLKEEFRQVELALKRGA
ncbi:MAG: photosystem II protein Psb27 [Gomphosphaeria aponina SAG 52.96 = DSM 107014]|uniref:Photosystem II lipoprotein Psb27 n=1 Tax=Gomphosphaeria aponina SAG 52.96 = DSM 107014 TaxID=1521640 RepID=A0A941GYG9_9CHRO|nr:photosystem II protein Psb27 [Gomphosphaeria aponina SAG 52.96 = DSM 107014]